MQIEAVYNYGKLEFSKPIKHANSADALIFITNDINSACQLKKLFCRKLLVDKILAF